MIKPGTALLLFITLFYVETAVATNYYLSNKGNDNNNGTTKKTPWLSLKRLSEHTNSISPGDSILLERGGLFRGNIDITCSDIYVGAYNTGAKPIVTGAHILSEWKYFKDNIWTSSCTECSTIPGNLFINGRSHSLGRYPDVGYLTTSGSSQSQHFLRDSKLNFPNDYWNLAEVVVKSSRWTLDRLLVDHFNENTFHFSQSASYTIENGFGYFLQNHYSTLNQNGEWYFNPESKLIYLYLDDEKDPSDLLVEVGIIDIGLTAVNAKNITIEQLAFHCNRITGIQLLNGSNIELRSIDISSPGKNGMEITGNDKVRITNSTISNSNNNGVQWLNNSNGVFSQNTICRTGLQPGRGESGNGTYIGINITSDKILEGNNLFQFNTIDSTGYSAIDFRTRNTQIKNNIINNFCMTKDDGGGIYTWGNTQKGNLIEDNIISNGVGSGNGTAFPQQLYASGIYIDDRSSQVVIKGNRIFNCVTSGIFLHNAKSITLTNNIVYANGYNISNPEKGQLYIRLDTLGLLGKKSLELKVNNNHWLSENDATHCVYVSVERKNDINNLGTFSANHYNANSNHQAIAALIRENGSCLVADEYSLKNWQDSLHYEKGSIFKPISSPKHFNMLGIGNLILNGDMTKDIKGWMVWPDKSSIQQESIKILDGPSLKINVPAGSTEALIYHEGFSLTKGKLYRLSFSAISPYPSQVEFVPLMATSPWHSLGGYACFSIGTRKKTFTHFFIPHISSSSARVNFKSHAGFWIDNVSLNEVE